MKFITQKGRFLLCTFLRKKFFASKASLRAERRKYFEKYFHFSLVVSDIFCIFATVIEITIITKK